MDQTCAFIDQYVLNAVNVIGRQCTDNENDTILFDYRTVCSDGEPTITFDIIQSDATRPDNVVYHAINPKLGNEET